MVSQVFVRLDGFPKWHTISFQGEEIDCSTLKGLISQSEVHTDVALENVYILINGRKICDNDRISNDQHVHLCSRIPGGKGGFGSMLRAIGAQIEKTTNREACRDLSGRRLRDIAEEMRLKKWIAKQSEREEEKANRRREKMERRLTAPRHEFHDLNYDKQRSEIPNKVNDALMQGLAVSKSSSKRSGHEIKATTKKPKLWLGVQEDLEGEVSSDEMETSSESTLSEPEDLGGVSLKASSPSAMGGHIASTSQDQESPETSLLTVDRPKELAKVPLHSVQSESCDHSDKPVSGEHSHKPESCEHAVKPESNVSVQESSIDAPTQAATTTLEQPETTQDIKVLNLNDVETTKELESLGLDRLKAELVARGMKCGGTLQQRAERLFSVKGLSADQIKPSLLARPAGKVGKPKKSG